VGDHAQGAFAATLAPSDWREWLLPAFLFLATILSTSYAGLFYVFGDVGFMQMALAVAVHPTILLQGVPFSFTLVTILLAHEMGHYLACRHYGIRCTPPFFLPLPVSYAGTLGAFIRIKSHFQHRRALFDVGVAGPLAGFAFVIPALVVGIGFSSLIPRGSIRGAISFGEPLLFRWVGKVVLGYSPDTQDMLAHPIAMAAWFGMLATSLNLFPIWQLDGGHITYAILGREHQKRASVIAAIALMLISLIGWPIPSYLLFACLLFFIGMRSRFYHPPTLFEDEKIGTARVILGIVALLILIVSFTPVPISLS
jgi:membrane-associated protease RseP (regulator of RpoE activity)